jgi:hypothetical protein
MGVIYALCDPSTDEIRYVGKTVKSPEWRLTRHLYEARTGTRYVHNWIRSLDGPPKVIVLEETEDLDQAERDWIAGLRSVGYRLTNLTDGGDGTRAAKSEIHKQRISESLKRRFKDPAARTHMGVRKGIKLSPERCAEMSAARIGKKLGPHSAETRQAISAGLRRAYAEGRRT